jgi:hypothetical protein
MREDDNLKGFLAGIEATQRELDKVFVQHGITRIAAQGLRSTRTSTRRCSKSRPARSSRAPWSGNADRLHDQGSPAQAGDGRGGKEAELRLRLYRLHPRV